MKLLAMAILTAAVVFSPSLALAQSAPFRQPGQEPEFVFGFKALSDLLGEKMGEPLECEHTEVSTGDAHQQTSKGLSFYRKATNNSDVHERLGALGAYGRGTGLLDRCKHRPSRGRNPYRSTTRIHR